PRAIASRSAPSDSAKPRSSAPLCRRQSSAWPDPLGVVHILVSGKATKYRLPEQPGQCVPTILATACVGQNITRHLGQTERVVEFAISQQPASEVTREPRNWASSGGRNPAEQHLIPIHPLGAPWPPRSIQDKMLIAISESGRPRRNSGRYPVNAGLRQSLATHPASGERPRNFTCVISSGCRGSNPTLSNAASTCSRVTTKFAFAMKTSPAPKSDHASDQYDQRRRDNSSCHRAGRGNLGKAAVQLMSALLKFAGRHVQNEGSLGGHQR